jgi:hypothetical protein
VVLVGFAMLSVISIGVGYAFYSSDHLEDYPFVSGFESGNLADWDGMGATQRCCPHSINVVGDPVRHGKYAVAMKITPIDKSVRGSKRSEIRLKGAEFGTEYWYSFSVYLSKDWMVGGHETILAQWHGVRDMILGEIPREPPLRLSIVRNKIRIETYWDHSLVSRSYIDKTPVMYGKVLWTGPVEIGQWTDWIFRVHWSYRDDGIVQVWRNNEKVVDYNGPNAFNDFVGPYLKLGVYVPLWGRRDIVPTTSSRLAFFDSIRVHKGSISKRDKDDGVLN